MDLYSVYKVEDCNLELLQKFLGVYGDVDFHFYLPNEEQSYIYKVDEHPLLHIFLGESDDCEAAVSDYDFDEDEIKVWFKTIFASPFLS